MSEYIGVALFSAMIGALVMLAIIVANKGILFWVLNSYREAFIEEKKSMENLPKRVKEYNKKLVELKIR